MNSALVYQLQCTIKNTFKSALKHPLKSIGVLIAAVYFIFLPFLFQDLIIELGLNNNAGFIIIYTIAILYLTLPTTLTYFKRNGVNFRKADVNFMFATPIKPKLVLFYGLVKQAYLNVGLLILITVAATMIFKLPLFTVIVYGVLNLILSSLMDYSLAMILYGSEKISDKTKKIIKYVMYGLLTVITLLSLYSFFNLNNSIISIVQSPLILLTPIFGFKIGFVSLFFYEINIITITSSILYIISAFGLFYLAYNMDIRGDYYEDGIKFTEKQAKLKEKQGKVSFLEALGKKKKVHTVEAEIKGSYAKAIFSKQLIERRRVNKFFFKFFDGVMFGLSIGAAILFFDEISSPSLFFAITVGVSLYISIFFDSNKKWLEEFNHYYLYVIPASNYSKLIYATLMEVIDRVIIACFLTLPAGLILGIPIGTILLSIISQIFVSVMLIYKTILFEGYFEKKIGVMFTQLISVFSTMILLIVPLIAIVISVSFSEILGTAIIVVYGSIIAALLSYFSSKLFNNIENIMKLQ